MNTLEMMLEAIALYKERLIPEIRLIDHLESLSSQLPKTTMEEIAESYYKVWEVIEVSVEYGLSKQEEEQLRTILLPELKSAILRAIGLGRGGQVHG